MSAPKLCECGRPTVTPYQQYCAVCIRTAKPNGWAAKVLYLNPVLHEEADHNMLMLCM